MHTHHTLCQCVHRKYKYAHRGHDHGYGAPVCTQVTREAPCVNVNASWDACADPAGMRAWRVGLPCVCVLGWHVRVAGRRGSGKPVCPGESRGPKE